MSTSTAGADCRAGFLRTTRFPLGNAGREGESRATASWAVIGTPRSLRWEVDRAAARDGANATNADTGVDQIPHEATSIATPFMMSTVAL